MQKITHMGYITLEPDKKIKIYPINVVIPKLWVIKQQTTN